MLLRRLDRANVEHFFRFRVADTLRRQDEDTKDNKDDAENRDGSHILQSARCGPIITLLHSSVVSLAADWLLAFVTRRKREQF